MQPELIWNYDDIKALPEKVSSIYDEHGISISPSSDLSKILKLCANIEFNQDMLPEIAYARRVLQAIIDCVSEKICTYNLRE